MKRNVTTMITVMAVITLTSCGDAVKKKAIETDTSDAMETSMDKPAEILNASFSDELTRKVYQNYQQIRKALIDSNAEGVNQAAAALAENFTEEKEGMKAMAMAMADANDIEKQREIFSQFTAKVEPMLKASIDGGAIYKQFCPMAFEGNGGYWISSTEQIENPYYGDRMLKCGTVKETITK